MRETLIELLTAYFGVDPAYYGIEAAHLADRLIEHGVTVQEDCKDCAEATQNCIVKLQEQIAEFRSVQEWISVKDRLPEQYHSVIVWTSDKELGEAEHDGKQFRWAYDDECANVTHWMEFPQPPKGE